MKTKDLLAKYEIKYLDSRLIFVLDCALSVLSSVVILLVVNFFSSDRSFAGAFAAWWIVSAIAASIVACLTFKSYKIIIRHSTIRDYLTFTIAFGMKSILMLLIMTIFGFFSNTLVLIVAFDFLQTLFFIVFVRILMVVVYDFYKVKTRELRNSHRVLIYGTSDKSVAASTRLQNSTHFSVMGFITPDDMDQNHSLAEKKVYFYRDYDKLKSILESLNVDHILFAYEKDAKDETAGLLRFCTNNGIKPLIVPSIDEVVDGKIMRNKVREVCIEDLLGREEIKLSMNEIYNNFHGKVVMVTGAAGSIGSEICRQLASFGVKKLILFDNAETPMHNIRLELEERYPGLDFVPVIGDVRQKPRLDFAFRNWNPQVVFHAAAYKHVPLMEENPCEAVLVNVIGSRNVADKCIEYGVEKMVMISTDKAVNPTNIMGCTKRLAEIYVQSLGLAIETGHKEGRTKFVTTRFGNVLGSNGSVIPRFREQISKGGPVTVTDPRITRFFMTIPEACSLVLEAATASSGNRICVFDMGESVKIDTLARKMIELAGLKVGEDIDIEYTGLRPGEKLYEEVLSNKENTIPTDHDRIHIAKVRSYDYIDAVSVCDQLEVLSRAVNIPEMVILMKKTVPEFKSKNSPYEKYD